ncbi:MAG: hypothetical protein C5B53_02050 [Candidatus Melainabacteria bacterium]|nr:MAG: hypothetical protein C5B53_02050 [Candidatus Melainabacteria bacterium]
MIIRIVLLALFFAYVVRAPMDFRTKVLEASIRDNPELRLLRRQSDCERGFLEAVKLPVGDKLRQQAISDLALVRWRQLKFQDAENLYRLALIENKPSKDYDQALLSNMLKLAAVYRDESKFAEARSVYLATLAYDQKFLSKSDTRIGRDLSNLGINYYIEACSKDRVDPASKMKDERTSLMLKAKNYLDQSLKFFGDTPENQQLASIALSNRCLVLRDLGEGEAAKIDKSRANRLDNAEQRLCKLP